MRFWSRGLSEFLRASLGRSSRIRHRSALTEKAWKDVVQGLGKSESAPMGSCLNQSFKEIGLLTDGMMLFNTSTQQLALLIWHLAIELAGRTGDFKNK